MRGQPLHRSRFRRAFVAGGSLFVIAASLGLVAYQELELPLPNPRPGSPVVLRGRLFTRSARIKVDGVLVHFRPPDPMPRGRRNHVVTAVTDRFGNFSFEANFRGPAHLFLDRHRLRDWTYRAIPDITLPTNQRTEIQLLEGPNATGRVIKNGEPAAGIGLALKFVEPAANDCYWLFEEITDETGRFRFEHLPERVEFWLSALRFPPFDPQPTEKLPDDHTFTPIRFRTGRDGTTLDLGDFDLRAGVTLAGQVVLADGKSLPENCVVAAGPPGAGGWVYSHLDKKGQFQIKGLPRGTIAAHIEVRWSANSPGYPVPLPGYRLSAKNACLDPTSGSELVGRLDSDRSDLTILLEPIKGAGNAGAKNRSLAPNAAAPDSRALAQFQKASAGPITGVAAIH
jgi:hypothetical protein